MNYRYLVSAGIAVAAAASLTSPLYAAEKSGTYLYESRIRPGAGANTSILSTVPANTRVSICEEKNGWMKVKTSDGKEGWSAGWLLKVVAAETPTQPVVVSTPQAHAGPNANMGTYVTKADVFQDRSLTSASLGRLDKGQTVTLLERRGMWYRVKSASGLEGWSLVSAITASFQSGSTTTSTSKLSMGKYIGLTRVRKGPSTSNAIITTVPSGTRVEIIGQQGEWYQVKVNGVSGWSMVRLISVDTNAQASATAATQSHVAAIGSEQIGASQYQWGTVPDGVDLVALNKYWQEKINALRRAKGLKELSLDQRWIDTASKWAGTMARLGRETHTDESGLTMHQRIDKEGLQFTVRNSPGGWVGNYFTENVSESDAQGNTADVEKEVLDRSMDFFLNEGPTGPHYKTMYHTDWNSMGAGFAFVPKADGRYTVYVAFHYGSLQ